MTAILRAPVTDVRPAACSAQGHAEGVTWGRVILREAGCLPGGPAPA